jgi:hypothetical protein
MLSTIQKSNRRVYPAFTVFLIAACASLTANAQQVTEVITDFGGYWRSSSTTNNTVFPNNSHNVLAFKAGTQMFSTGIKDSVLNSNGISYVPGNFKALPISSIDATVTANSSIFIALAALYDGNPTGYSTPPPGVKMRDVLTDGINGLDIGTGVTNIPAGGTLTFGVKDIVASQITDSKPDILYTQIADPSGASDILYFTNSSGVRIGNTVSVSWTSVSSLGTYYLDLYDMQAGVSCDVSTITAGYNKNVTRNIRLTSFNLSDFGITTANAASVTNLVVKPAGTSDPAFVAYNSDAFTVLPPAIVVQPQPQTACVNLNQSATFSVTATGSGITYQWMKNGVNIAGATAASYTINNVTSADLGYYEVVVTNTNGTVTSSRAYLNTAITQQPSPASQSIVTGNSVTLTVAATNATGYQWKKDTVDIPGATSASYTINPLTTTNGGSYTVKVINSAAGGCASLLSTPAVIVPVTVVYSTASGQLNVPGTWGINTDGSGSKPVDFTRPEHTFVINNRTTGNTRTNLTIAGTLDVKNAVTTIPANTTLDVGRLIRSGTGSIAGTNSSALTLRGNSDLYFYPTQNILQSLTVAAGTVTAYTPLLILGSANGGRLNITGGNFIVNDTITLKSTSVANTSIVTTIGAGASINYGTAGAFLTERFIPERRAYRFISPTVTSKNSIKANWMENANNVNTYSGNIDPVPGYGTHITGRGGADVGFDATQTNNASLFTFSPLTQKWVEAANPNGTLVAGAAYRLMVRGNRSVNLNDNASPSSSTVLREVGVLQTGSVTVPSSSFSSGVGKYSLIGNPYDAPINWNTISKTGLSTSYYAWDPNVGTRGTYISYNGTSGINSSSLSNVNYHIQPGQAFFVQTAAENPTLQFAETNKTEIITNVYRPPTERPKMAVQLLTSLAPGAENAADAFVAVYDESFSENIGDEESFKIINLDENIAINRNGTALSIEGRPIITKTDSLPIIMSQFRQKEYFIKIDAQNFAPELSAYIKDKFVKSEILVALPGVTIVPFSITTDPASSAIDRFTIVFKPASVLAVNVTDLAASVKNEGIQLKWIARGENNIDHYEVEKSVGGSFIKIGMVAAKSNNGTMTTYNFYDKDRKAGKNFYRLKIVEKSGDSSFTAVVKVNVGATTSELTIFPNPVSGKAVGIAVNNVTPGIYQIAVNNSNGQKIYAGTISISSQSGFQQVNLEQQLPTGVYNLQLIKGDIQLKAVLIAK